DVAKELAGLHQSLGVKRFEVVPPQPKLTQAVDELLRKLTNGACRATTGSDGASSSIDAVVIAGTNPNYVAVAQEFPRLAHWAPGKKHGYILVAAAAKMHAVTAWRALAIEDLRAEEALQRATVEAGYKDRRLTWEEVPFELRQLVYDRSPKEQAEIAVARGVYALGDNWDSWLGRLAAFRDQHGHVKVRYLATIFGHELGAWVMQQRERWECGTLDDRKVARLKGLGFMLDLEAELFALGLSELRTWVMFHRSRVVPISFTTDAGFALGSWVVEQRTLQRRGRLGLKEQKMLKEAFFMWSPSEAPTSQFDHPQDQEAAVLTRSIEGELRMLRWRPIVERRQFFRSLVLKHHPDVSPDPSAPYAIQFLSDTKEWFLAGH
ncbi:unnamed protein product, partial [Polarella glacialis]